MKNKVYTVHAYRWGGRENHSYSVGVYTRKNAAINAGKAEKEYRGGKYICEILEWTCNSTNEDGSHGMPYKIIKPLPRFDE